MNRSETALLLALCASFDRRTVGDADVRAWQTVLASIDYEQANEAVLAHYAESRDWIMPADIRQRVRKARAVALEDFQYEPVDPDETPQQYLANRRRQMRAVASGERPPVAPALPASRRPLELAAVGQLPAEQPTARDIGPRGIRCPICGAQPGKSCKTAVFGRRKADVHPSRLDAYRSA
jgi:hypothetical protein